MNTHLVGLTGFVLAALLGVFTLAGEARGEGAAPDNAKMCQGCHGQEGNSSKDSVPSIAEISVPVHADALRAYRDGSRTCADPKSKMMCGVSRKLTDAQIESLAEFFAAMEFKAAIQEFDANKAAAGASIHEENCEKCHTAGGSDAYDDASILAGQWMPYLRLSLAQFADGTRDQPEAMKAKFEKLGEADLEALVHYYASQQ